MNLAGYREMLNTIYEGIPELKGYTFGTSLQVMQRFSADAAYPMMWAEYPSSRIVRDASTPQAKMHQCSIAVFKHVNRDAVQADKDVVMDECESIADTVLRSLIEHFRQPTVNDLFDISSITLRPIEMMFADNLHGWALEFQFSTPWNRFNS
jgi:hypothetical protein